MELQKFPDYLNQGNTVISGSGYSLMMHKLAQEALQITAGLNNAYHTPAEICEIFSRLEKRSFPGRLNTLRLTYSTLLSTLSILSTPSSLPYSESTVVPSSISFVV